MKSRLSLVVLMFPLIVAACARADRETPVAPTIAQTTASSTPTTAPVEPPTPLPAPTRPLTPTAAAMDAAFVSVLPTPTWTPTFTPSPTPWPTLTPLPAMSPATPVLTGMPELGVDWIQPVGYWRDNWGRQEMPFGWRSDDWLIIGGAWPGALQAISIDDGTVAWQYAPPSKTGDDVHTRIDSVAVADGIVAVQADHKLLALNNRDGQPVWSIDLGLQKDILAAAGNRLYLRDTGVYPTQVAALDANTGEEHWRYDCPGSFDPVLATPNSLLIACQSAASTLAITQLSAETGALLRLQPVPIQGFDIMGSDQDVLVLRFPVPGSPGYNPAEYERYQLSAHDWETGSLLWEAYLPDLMAARVDGDGVLIADGNQIQRRSLRDGETQWITTLPVDDHALRVAQSVSDGDTVLIGSDSGFLYALDRQTGDLLWMEDIWGVLGLPWRPVTPLGVEGDTILVWMSLADGNAVAGLRRGASPAPWPTPTFVPDSALQMSAPTAAPTPSGTSVPADWTPEPVRWDPSNTSEIPRVEREMRDQLLTWLNLHPGGYEEFNRQVSQWPSRPYAGEGTFDFPPDYVSWVHHADLDSDGNQEDIIALGVRLKTWAVLENEGQQTYIVYASEPNPNYLGATPEFVLADDINCDGQDEVVVQWRGSGTWGDFIHAYVHQWDGSTWRDLGGVSSSGTASVRGEEPNIDFVDTDDDGCREAVANDTPSHQSVTRPQTLTFAFRDGSYQQVDAIGAPSHLGYYKVIDANRALARGDLDSALELALQALHDPETGMSSDGGRVDVQRYENRIAAYAAAEAMLVHALRGEIDAIESLLQQVETSHNRPDNPYLPAAQALGKTYVATRDALAACRAMEQVVRLWGDTELVQFGSERLQIEQICPLD